jgi:ribokinase
MPESKALIRIIGSINVDFTTVTPRFPQPGETLTARFLSINAGGKGANQAVACGRASFSTKDTQDVVVQMVGSVGANDPYYTSLIEPTLKEAGVDCTRITKHKHSQTGTATIIVDEGAGGENRILVVPGANHDGMRASEELLNAASNPTPSVLIMQGEIPPETVFDILLHLQKKGQTLTILNPAPMFQSGIPDDYFKCIDILIVNETEFQDLARSSKLPISLDRKQDGMMEKLLTQASLLLEEKGLSALIVTFGADYVWVSINKVRKFVSTVKVERVVDTTAAGDTFVGYFAVAAAKIWKDLNGGSDKNVSLRKLDGARVVAAVQLAVIAAAKSVQKQGAMQSIPWGFEVEKNESQNS